jgi:gluconolactonase
VTVWREGSEGTNGLGIAPGGDVVMCEGTARRVTRSPAAVAPAPTVVADSYLGDRFNSPNDVIVRGDGTIYFTDPTYGLGGGNQEIPFQGVFRVTPEGEVTLLADDFEQPNGIALSPDEAILYVTDSEAGGLHSFAVNPDGTTGSRVSLGSGIGGSDGMAVDEGGNLYLTTGNGVDVFRPDGTLRGNIPVPEQPANCTFGGPDRRTLLITARTSVYRVDLNVPGKP